MYIFISINKLTRVILKYKIPFFFVDEPLKKSFPNYKLPSIYFLPLKCIVYTHQINDKYLLCLRF